MKLLFSLLLIVPLYATGQIVECTKVGELLKVAEKEHYAPRPINEEFSGHVFDYLFETIDNEKMIFSSEDYQQFYSNKNVLTSDLQGGTCHFIEDVLQLYWKRLNQVKSALEKMDVNSFNFDEDEFIHYGADIGYTPAKEKIKRWKKKIKYETLIDHFSDTLNQDKSVSDAVLKNSIQRELCSIKSTLAKSTLIFDEYLNAVAMSFDPHTNYFSLSDKVEFDQGVSKESASFGFELGKNQKGQIAIAALVPGGPAWRTNELNEEDVIVSVEYKEKVTSFLCISIKEVSAILNNSENNEMTFKIAKKNGLKKSIKLKKEVVEVRSNIIQSYVLNGEKKIGYIYLPSFYTNATYGDYLMANGCANDIAKELFKLKREGVEGLIIDLRNNGGGSMLEATRLSGVFIDYGAVAIADQKGQEAQTIKDLERGMAFTKPVVVMVNEFSASASEFFAAAMQDQNRAVIVGSSTFGKATMQTIVPINDEAYLKTTVGKFFRVTGKSHQGIGVQPDVPLPGLYGRLGISEKDMHSSLPNTEITHKTYYYPKSDLPIEKLKTASQERVGMNPYFKQVLKTEKLIYVFNTNVKVPLKQNDFLDFYHENVLSVNKEIAKYSSENYTVENPTYLNDIRTQSEKELLINQKTIERIQKSSYISESYNIILDLIAN